MESFDQIVPIIFLVIWTFIAILGKKKKKKQAPGPANGKSLKPARQSPFLGNLQSTLENVFAQLEKPPQEVLPEKPKSPEPSNSEVPFEDDYSREKTDSEVATPVDMTFVKNTPKENVSYSTKKRKSTAANLSIEKLKNAVIWSEILAKPVALRDE